MKKRSTNEIVLLLQDTIINGQTIFRLKVKILWARPIVRSYNFFDSANSIYSYPDRQVRLTLDQSKEFSVQIGITDDNHSLATVYYSIDTEPITVNVPPGNYATINNKGRVEPNQTDYPLGIRTLNNYYSKGTGLIKKTCYMYSSPATLEMRLVKTGSI